MAALVALYDENIDEIYYINLYFKNSLIDYEILSKNFNTKLKVLELLNYGNITEFKNNFPFIVKENKSKREYFKNNIKEFFKLLTHKKYEMIYLFNNNQWNFLNLDEFYNLYNKKINGESFC
jgi:hypothetical protein